MPLAVASFNVNSIKARLDNLLAWLRSAEVDVVCLQEIKCVDENFPRAAMREAGYEALVHGQKSYNGVAILSRRPVREVARGLPADAGADDVQARYLEAEIEGVRIACLYLPNGNPTGGEKFAYKLAWMERLRQRAQTLLEAGGPVLLAGDFNVIPEPEDCHDPRAWEGDALFLPETRRAFRELVHAGYYDAFRTLHPDDADAYTFWDYQGGAWQRGHGIRIDHVLLSPEAVDRLAACRIDEEPRGASKASDHTPIIVELR